ncbi:MAG: hypothetical protein MZV70_06275 [Desulfobacterales bacterium]|nr:hypothetical protein [Desulfobacterales bacterium]
MFGEVQKPGAYTFSGSEMRLIDAISEAGGPTRLRLPDRHPGGARGHHAARDPLGRPRAAHGKRRPVAEPPPGQRGPGVRAAQRHRRHQALLRPGPAAAGDGALARARRHRLEQRGRHHRREVRNASAWHSTTSTSGITGGSSASARRSILFMVLLVGLCSYGFAKFREPAAALRGRLRHQDRPLLQPGLDSHGRATGASPRTWRPMPTSSPATRC